MKNDQIIEVLEEEMKFQVAQLKKCKIMIRKETNLIVLENGTRKKHPAWEVHSSILKDIVATQKAIEQFKADDMSEDLNELDDLGLID